MQRKFITNLGLLLLLNLLIKPFWVFGIDRTVQNVVGVQEFGFYYAILNFSFLFNILLDLGITNFNNRNIAQNTQLLAKHFSGIVSLKLLLGFLYFLVTIGFGLIWGFEKEQLSLLALVGFNQFLLSFILYIRSNISGMLMFRTESIMSVLDRILMIIIMSVILWGNVYQGDFKIEWFVYAQTIAYLIAAIIGYLIVLLKSKSLVLNWNVPFFLMILRKSLPFAVLSLLMVFYIRIDSVMLGKLLPKEQGEIQSGIFAHAYRILEATNQISFLFAVLLLPLFSYLIKKKEELGQILKASFSLLFVGTSCLAFGTYFYSFELMDLMYFEHIEESAKVYSILIFGVIAMGLSYIYGTLLTANGNLKELIIIAGISLITSLVLNLILIPHLFAVGAAIANLSALIISIVLQLLVVEKKFEFVVERNYFVRLIIYTLGSISFAYSSLLIPLDWKLNLLIYFSVNLVLAMALKLIDFKYFKLLIQGRDL